MHSQPRSRAAATAGGSTSTWLGDDFAGDFGRLAVFNAAQLVDIPQQTGSVLGDVGRCRQIHLVHAFAVVHIGFEPPLVGVAARRFHPAVAEQVTLKMGRPKLGNKLLDAAIVEMSMRSPENGLRYAMEYYNIRRSDHLHLNTRINRHAIGRRKIQRGIQKVPSRSEEREIPQVRDVEGRRADRSAHYF